MYNAYSPGHQAEDHPEDRAAQEARHPGSETGRRHTHLLV